jgi:hypothetical protein
VHRAATIQPNPDRTNLARVRAIRIDPHARVLLESPDVGKAELDKRVDDRLLDPTDVANGVSKARFGPAKLRRQAQNRVPNQLAGAVIGDVATPVDSNKLSPNRGRLDKNIRRQIGAGPVGEHMVMFQQQQMLLPTTMAEQCLLKAQRLPVRDTAQPPDPQRCDHNSAAQSRVSRTDLTLTRNPAAYAPSNAR